MSRRNTEETLQSEILQKMLFLWLCVFLACVLCGGAEKIRYASSTECDRYSLDAVYNEKFKIITENVFKDCREFVNRVTDLVSESLTSIMAELPDRDASDDRENKIFSQFKSVKKAFSSRVKNTNKKITASWESLIASNFDLMYDNGKSSLVDYVNKTKNMTDSYDESRKSLDVNMGSFISFVKGIVRDGIQGISAAAADSIKKDESNKKNDTDGDESNKDATNKNEGKTKEDKLLEKKVEIAEMILKGFLRKITVEVIRRKIDLFKKTSTKPEDRDSVLDDLQFDILLIKNRILAIIQDDLPKDKGSIDLARRSIYTYWADIAEQMYIEKIKSKQTSTPGGDLYYKKLWGDDEELMNTLLNLMEVYS